MQMGSITVPGGSDTEVQYNNGGIFGGDSTFTLNDTTKVVNAKGLTVGDATNNVKIETDGDMHFVAGAGFPCGSLYIHEGAANVDLSGAGADTYVKVTGFDAGVMHNVSENSDAFNVGYIGTYKVDWQISADSQGNNLVYECDIFVNGVEQSDGSSRIKFGAAADYSSFSGTAILQITDTGHDIDLRIKGVSTDVDIDIFNLNFNIVQIAGITAPITGNPIGLLLALTYS